MPIRPKVPLSEIDRYTDAWLRNRSRAMLRNMEIAGERLVNIARGYKDVNDYQDDTGNLRGSIGYVIVMDGEIVNTGGFEKVLSGNDGPRDGMQFARELARRYSRGICLILVAGMDYAVHVSNMGRDVIESAELQAPAIIRSLLRQLGVK